MKKLVVLFVLIFALNKINAQVTSGTITVTGADSSTYSLLSGQLMLIDVGGNFTGVLNLNGGSVLNKGIFNPDTLNFNSGRFSNSNALTLTMDITLDGSKIFNTNVGGTSNVTGNIILSGGMLINSGTLNVSQNIQNNSGTFNNSGTVNCDHLTGSNTVNNTGTINTN